MRLGLLAPQFVGALLLTFVALGQQTQQPPTPPTTPPPTTPPTQPPPQPNTQGGPAPSNRPPGEFARPTYLTGCVRMEDGSVPPELVRIWITCPGSAGVPAGPGRGIEVDLRGCFKILKGVTGLDRSDRRLGPATGGRTSADLQGCEVRAELPGYGFGAAAIERLPDFADIDVGTIVLTPFPNHDPSTISLNSLSAPREAREAYLKAREQMATSKPNLGKAMKDLQKAVRTYPEYASAWQLLGEIHADQKDEPRARESFQKAITADPKYVTPYLSLGNIELRNQRWAELAALAGKIIQLKPDSVEGQYFNAVANYRLGKFEPAEKSARYCEEKKASEQYPSLHLILGDILSQRGDIPAAAGHFRSFLALRPDGQNSQMVRARLQSWTEQGLTR